MTEGRSPDLRRLAAALISWFLRERRDFPWRRKRTPYRVWVSEVMLQQTVADIVAPAFERFVARYPTLDALAAAPLDDVLREWAGLGYYRRARMLHAGARACRDQLGGRIPRTAAGLREIPGIGEYTSGAIASLAFGEAVPAVDGNVARVVSRFEALAVDVGNAAGRRRLGATLTRWMPADDAGTFNEALIELGATVCRPTAPRCDACPLASGCLAFQNDEVGRFPPPRTRRASVAITSARALVILRGKVLLQRRPKNASLLPDFEELPGRWLAPGEGAEAALTDVCSALGFRRVRVGEVVTQARHAITHHRITAVAHRVQAEAPTRLPDGVRFAPPADLAGRAVTTETRKLWAAQQVASA